MVTREFRREIGTDRYCGLPIMSSGFPSPQLTPVATPAYAHTLEGRPRDEWEPLEEHLAQVAELAGQFAAAFGAGVWGEILGRCHDLGKYSKAFQEYLLKSSDPDASIEGSGRRVDHSTFGARHVNQQVGGHKGQLLAFCIAGHHRGLPDATADDEAVRRSTLQYRLDPTICSIPPVTLPQHAFAPASPSLPFRPQEAPGFQVAFFARMLFSALIDADRIATERFCQPEQATERAEPRPSTGELQVALNDFLAGKAAASPATCVNQARMQVLNACRTAAQEQPGFFSLNVPTGGGKTLSSLAFALDHAVKHQLRRIVVALPFTSIIEQTADAYRQALGPQSASALIEHHSNIDPKHDTRENQLASENWDAPLIVTTNVQLYESLFAGSTRSCRKLHRLAGSVIILDEAQTIPVDLLAPTLAALQELVLNYGCSVVLCTATQPAILHRPDFAIGLPGVRPIIQDTASLFNALKRVEVTHLGKLTDEVLAERLSAEPSVLCVVNTRAHAARLFDLLAERCGGEGTFHLSTYMCGQHRRAVLQKIRDRLAAGQTCRVVSTQLIEAGVDVDFPAVYRAPAGFDSIAQAAGRCNREGLLERGRVYLFNTETLPPAGLLRASAQAGEELIAAYPDPLAPEAIEAYFRLFYWSRQQEWDKHEVLPPLNPSLQQRVLALQFETAAQRYRIIREEQEQVLVAYDERARTLRDRLFHQDLPFVPQREAQPYLVGVRTPILRALQERGVVYQHDSGVWLLMNVESYTPEKGLTLEGQGIDVGLMIF